MKKIHTSLIVLCLILSFQIILDKAYAANGTMVYVDPMTVLDVPVGETFTINASVSDVVELSTWQVTLLFNSTVLSCTDAIYPPDNILAGHGTVTTVSPIINNIDGSVKLGATLMGTNNATGSGTMCQIVFEVLAIGESDLEFSPYGGTTYLIDVNGEDISATTQDGFFTNLPTPFHDLAVTDLSLSDHYPKQNDSVLISVQVLNNGTVAETFNVSVFYGSSLIETRTVADLGSGAYTTLDFNWDTTGVPLGSYIVKAEADTVPLETNVANNIMTTNVNVISPTALPTDLNGDGQVDMKDVGEVARAFGADPGHPRWNPAADIDVDGVVTMKDICIVCRDFGKISA